MQELRDELVSGTCSRGGVTLVDSILSRLRGGAGVEAGV